MFPGVFPAVVVNLFVMYLRKQQTSLTSYMCLQHQSSVCNYFPFPIHIFPSVLPWQWLMKNSSFCCFRGFFSCIENSLHDCARAIYCWLSVSLYETIIDEPGSQAWKRPLWTFPEGPDGQSASACNYLCTASMLCFAQMIKSCFCAEASLFKSFQWEETYALLRVRWV